MQVALAVAFFSHVSDWRYEMTRKIQKTEDPNVNNNPEQEEKEVKKPRVRKPRASKKIEAEQPAVAEAPVAEVIAEQPEQTEENEDGEVTDEDGETEEESDEDESMVELTEEEAKLSPEEQRAIKEERRRMRRETKSRRRSNKKARQATCASEKQEERESGRPIVQVPETVTCHVHVGEQLKVSEDPQNAAFALNRTLINELCKVDSIPENDPRFKLIVLMRTLSPLHFNFDNPPPAFCLPALRAIEKAVGMARLFLPKTHFALRQPTSYTYHSGYSHWENWRDEKKGELEGGAWKIFDGIIERHVPEMKGERDPGNLANAGLEPEVYDEMRAKLMEKPELRYYRKSEASRTLRQIFEINRRKFEEERLSEALEAKERSEQDRIERESTTLEGVDELLGLMGVGSAQQREDAIIDENETAMREWLSDLVSGKFTTADGLYSFHDIVEVFDRPDAEVQSMCPYSMEKAGTQFSTYLGYNSIEKSLFVTVTVPVLVVNRDREPLKDKETGKRIYVPRYVVLSAKEGRMAADIRRETLVKAELAKNPGLERKEVESMVRAKRDDRAAWKTGKLKGSMGNLGVFDLSKTVQMVREKAENQDSSQSAAPRRNTRGGTHGNENGGKVREASQDETQAWLAGQNPEQISAKPRLKSNGG